MRCTFAAAVALVLSCAAPSFAAPLIFDAMSNVTAWINPTATNTFIGSPFVPAGQLPTFVSGMDVVLANTGAAINANNLVLHVYFWDAAALTTTGSADAFSNLAGAETITFGPRVIGAASKTVMQDPTNPGVSPAIDLPISITLAGSNFGVSFNWQADLGNGLQSISGLTTAVRSGVAPAVGSNPVAGANGAYYRNQSGRVDGNFNGGDAKNNGLNSNAAFRLYAPEPSSLAVIAMAGAACCRRSRSA